MNGQRLPVGEPLGAPQRYAVSATSARVLEAMRPGFKYSAAEIAAALDISEHFAGTHLARMVERNQLVRLGTRRFYRYALPPHNQSTNHAPSGAFREEASP